MLQVSIPAPSGEGAPWRAKIPPAAVSAGQLVQRRVNLRVRRTSKTDYEHYSGGFLTCTFALNLPSDLLLSLSVYPIV